jgi:hypothetical protein
MHHNNKVKRGPWEDKIVGDLKVKGKTTKAENEISLRVKFLIVLSQCKSSGEFWLGEASISLIILRHF